MKVEEEGERWAADPSRRSDPVPDALGKTGEGSSSTKNFLGIKDFLSIFNLIKVALEVSDEKIKKRRSTVKARKKLKNAGGDRGAS